MSPKINSKLSLVSIFTLVLAGAATTGAQAQGVQNWINNEVNKVQQQYAGGAINPTQAAGLQNRVQQIQNQEAVDMSQNGGTLTPQQSQQIGSELRRTNQRMNNAVYNNNPYAASGAYQQAPYTSGAYPRPIAGQYWHNNQGQFQNNPNYMPPVTGQGQYPYNGHHHHHRYEQQNQ